MILRSALILRLGLSGKGATPINGKKRGIAWQTPRTSRLCSETAIASWARSSISATPARNSGTSPGSSFVHQPTRRTLWAEQRCTELGDGHFHAQITSLAAQPLDSPEAQLCNSRFRTHRERMRYPAFLAQYLCVGSGVVEASCQSIVGSRLQRSGLHGSVAGAHAMLALLCSTHPGNRFDDFWGDQAVTDTPPHTSPGTP